MFPGWISLPGRVQYDLGAEDGTSYTASWKIPATLANLEICKKLVSKRDRFQMVNYPYKDKIEHNYYPDLTIYRGNIKGLDSFSQNTADPLTDSTSGSNVLQNVGYYEVTFDWKQKPWNAYRLKHARIERSMEGSFEEVPGSVLEAYPVSGSGTAKPLTIGMPKVSRQQEFHVIYEWVPADRVDFDYLEKLQGKINKDSSMFERDKGQVLYVNSETVDVIDSLGDRGYKVTHNFVLKPEDFNLVDITANVTSSTRQSAKGYANLKNLPNGEAYRAYEYADMKNDVKLFYYGWEV